MDWKKANEWSGPGTFVLTAAMLVLMVLQAMYPPVTAMPENKPAGAGSHVGEPAKSQGHVENKMIQWIPPFLVGLCIVGAALIHLKAAAISREHTHLPSESTYTPAEAAPASVVRESDTPAINALQMRVLSGDRVLIDISPEELTEFYQNRTSVEAARLVNPYLEKWIRVSGTVLDVEEDFVSLHGPVFLEFTDYWKGHAQLLKIGATISAIGQIKTVEKVYVRLAACELDS